MHRRLAVGLALAGMLSVTGGTGIVRAAEPIPLVIDSDMISDDWMATLFVLNDPDYDVKAITVTGTGFATCEAGVKSALGLLALEEYGDVPVACGAETPSMGTNGPPDEWMTTIEAVEALGLPDGGDAVNEDAVELFTTTVRDSPEPITVLALGPLTNLAAAFEATPDLVNNIEMIYIMGGAVDVDGSAVSDANTTAEWNIYSDPHAARIVFESGAPITLVPLDATNEAPVTPAFVEKLEAAPKTPASEFVAKLMENNAESIASGSYYFWDPLAAVVMAHPELVTTTERQVTVVDIPGDPNDGRTKPVANGSTIMVITEPNAEALEDALIAAWTK